VLRGTVGNENRDRYNYINFTKRARILRSSSKYFCDENGTVVGSLCINFDITDLVQAQKTINYSAFLDNAENTEPIAISGGNTDGNTKEVFTNNVDELLDIMLADTVNMIGKPVEAFTKDDKVHAIRYLDKKGAFLIKKSADKAADFFSISKFTLYNYLEN
jgi:predicted transcriptional regulator YheO